MLKDLQNKFDIIDQAPLSFETDVEKEQSAIFKSILKSLSKLELDENGIVKRSLKNIALIEPLGDKLRAIINDSNYPKLVQKFGLSMDDVKFLNDEYFLQAFDEGATKLYTSLYEDIKERQISKLSVDPINANVAAFKDILQDSIAQSDNFTSLIGNIQENIMGSSQVEGRLASYAKTYAKDIFSRTERTYTTVIAQSLDIQFYFYGGGKMDTSRKFCKDRVNKYFHYKEIQAWAKESWQGKAKDTDKKTIFSYCGGYNCQHSLVPIGIMDVPLAVIKRNIKNGNIKKEKLPKLIVDRL